MVCIPENECGCKHAGSHHKHLEKVKSGCNTW